MRIISSARKLEPLLSFCSTQHSGARTRSVLDSQHIVGGELRLAQQKTGELVVQPVHPAMLEAISAANMKTVGNVAPLAFLLNRFGQPYSAKGLANAVKDWMREAGLPHCSAHTIRKGTLTMLAESGRSTHEIGAYGGHKSLRMVEVYTRPASAGQGGCDRLWGRRENRSVNHAIR